MMYFSKKKIEDYSIFDSAMVETRAYFGLPSTVEYCTKCVISNQRPSSEKEYKHVRETAKNTIAFDNGVCSACRYAETKQTKIDWEERDRKLRDLCDKYRRSDGGYDCIVPGSGGKDSFFTGHVLKYKYGMNPLTVTWAPNMYTPWGWKNMEQWANSGLDNHLVTPRRDVQRLFCRIALENLLHPFQAFQFGQKFLAPRLAKLHGVSLVFYGEHQAEYGNDLSETEVPQLNQEYFCSDLGEDSRFIGGESVSDLRKNFGLNDYDLKHYSPLTSAEADFDLNFQYLGYYVPWHPQGNYYYAVENGGFVTAPERLSGTYTKYCSIDDKMEEFNFYLQGVKFGLGWTSYNSSFEVRSNDLLRDEAVAMVKRYDHEYPERWLSDFLAYVSLSDTSIQNIRSSFEYVDIDREYFDDLVDTFRSPHIWKRENDSWALRHQIERDWNEDALTWTGND